MTLIKKFKPLPPLTIGIIIEVNDGNSGRPLNKKANLMLSTSARIRIKIPIWENAELEWNLNECIFRMANRLCAGHFVPFVFLC